ncbi:MAG: cellulase family glycosylhydrolase [Anaerolineae bacterium]
MSNQAALRATGKAVLCFILAFLPACAAGLSPAAPTPTISSLTGIPAGAIMGIELTSERDGRAAELAGGTGARWARVPLRWKTIEPKQLNPPAYRFETYDQLLQDLRRRGFQIILTVRDNPSWAADTPCGPLNTAGAEALLRFLEQAVKRYHEPPYDVQHWELYNEPDNTDAEIYGAQGGCWGDAPAAYAELLRRAYPVIKGANPDAVVIFGGLALEQIEGNPFNVHFLEQTLDAGAGPFFDWANFHYYPAFSYRWNRFGRGIQGKTAYIQDILRKAGAEKPIICSEVGQPTAGPAREGYSDEKTADEMVRSYVRAVWAGLPTTVWHKLQDGPQDIRLYGLADAGGVPKPAYRTYQLLTRYLSRAYFQGELNPSAAGSLEAYQFAYDGEDFSQLLIAWRTDDGPAVTLPIPAPRLLAITAAGEKVEIRDGGEDDMDPAGESVGISVGSHPLFLLY